MRLHWIAHVPFEDLGAIEGWARDRGATLSVTRQWAGDKLPRLSAIDGLIIMGGPMGVGQCGEFPWLTGEIEYTAAALEAGLPTLGICLGAQIMAAALGAAVYPAREREIGWFHVDAVSDPVFALPRRFNAFHWHGETFDLPARVRLLASSPICPNQAFALNRHALALQFHLEITLAGAQRLAQACAADLAPGPRVQPVAEQLANPSLFRRAHGILGRLLGALFEGG